LRSEYYFKEKCFCGFYQNNLNILHTSSNEMPLKTLAQKTSGLRLQ
jgi:hypothetical protein